MKQQLNKKIIQIDYERSYEGETKHDLKHGYGVQVWSNGSKYEGRWFEGKAHGKGKFTYSNGETY